MFTLLTGPGYDADGDLSWGAHWFEESLDTCGYDWLRDEHCPNNGLGSYCITPYFVTSTLQEPPA